MGSPPTLTRDGADLKWSHGIPGLAQDLDKQHPSIPDGSYEAERHRRNEPVKPTASTEHQAVSTMIRFRLMDTATNSRPARVPAAPPTIMYRSCHLSTS